MTPGGGASPRLRPATPAVEGTGRLRLLKGGRQQRPEPPGARRKDRVSTRTAILGLTGALCSIGLVMVLSASAYTSLQYYGSVWTIFERQVLWIALGAIALALAARFPYRHWRRARLLLLFGTMVLLLAVLIPGIGVTAGGSSRWIGFGQFRIQPSELMKLALSVFAADLLARRSDRVHEARSVVAPLLVVLAVCAVLVLKQPDMGTALVLACITFVLLYAGGVPLRPVLKAVAAVGVVGLIVGLAEPYRRARLLSFLNPFAHAKGSGYQVVQSLVGLGSGHLYGLGLGGGREKWGLLPNAHTDFIFSVIGEEGGLVGTLFVLVLFAALAWYGVRAATRAPDRFGGLLAVACTCWITSQAVINIGAVIGVLPVTGIPLPFISFGGSSLVITMVAAGILANVAAHERKPTLRSPGGPTARGSAPGPSGRPLARR
ncbi:MAG TPA: putative lipid II flippase FtsW [Acidimicrobiales bacterium]|nr:putative lipid II flippase FtsW [Acidimicrobiales bacterium]